MKKIVLLAAAFSLAAPAAFAQLSVSPPTYGEGMKVFIRNHAADADSAGLVELITRAIDKNRKLTLIPTPEDDAVEVQAPLAVIKDKDGVRVTMTYEITPIMAGSGRVYTVECTVTQLHRCAEAVADRIERVGKRTF
jgi:hypothetical protein